MTAFLQCPFDKSVLRQSEVPSQQIVIPPIPPPKSVPHCQWHQSLNDGQRHLLPCQLVLDLVFGKYRELFRRQNEAIGLPQILVWWCCRKSNRPIWGVLACAKLCRHDEFFWVVVRMLLCWPNAKALTLKSVIFWSLNMAQVPSSMCVYGIFCCPFCCSKGENHEETITAYAAWFEVS